MWRAIPARLGAARRRVGEDLRGDRVLLGILVLAAILAGFYFWHLIPNFATRDERDRIFDFLIAFGTVLDDPSFEALESGITVGRAPFAATFYLVGIASLPAILAAAVMGRLELFETFANATYLGSAFGYYELWQATPRWLWTWTIGIVRFFDVCFAVGSVYVAYRIGLCVRDRATGRLAALLLALSFGFITIAHEFGEDMPSLFFVLLSILFSLQYIQDGDRGSFLLASIAGGVAIAFKFTAAPVVLVVGVAYLLRARVTGWRDALVRPKLLVAGAALGAIVIYLGFPSALVSGPDPIVSRIQTGAGRAGRRFAPAAPIWWWIARGYLNGLGLPLFLATVSGVLASLGQLRDRVTETNALVILWVPLVSYLLLFSRWEDLRFHHLLPTLPLALLLLAAVLVGAYRRAPKVAGPVIAFLLVTTAIYAGVGTAGYANEPRDGARAWLNENADRNATLEVYRRDMQDAAFPHWMNVSHLRQGQNPNGVNCPEYIELGYRDVAMIRPDSFRGRWSRGTPRVEYIRTLVNNESDVYRPVAEFGPRPWQYDENESFETSVGALFHAGLQPRINQFADEQELGPNGYTLLLERRGECEPGRNPPF